MPELSIRPFEFGEYFKQAIPGGLVLEFGVAGGTSLRTIATYVDKVYGLEFIQGATGALVWSGSWYLCL